jgi:hypothetical protein
VTDLVFTSTGAITSGTFAKNIDRLELYTVGATTPFATASVAGCGSDAVASNSMCSKMKNQEFIVPKGSNTNILVRPRVRTDIDGAVSGTGVAIRLDLTPSTTTGSVRARGLLSSNTLGVNDADTTPEGEVFVGVATAAANAHVRSNFNAVVLSKLMSITNADPNANGTAIPVGTSRQIAQFKFSTAAASNLKNGTNKWTLSGVIFNVNATNVQLGSGDNHTASTSTFKLYNKADPTVTSSCTASGGVVANYSRAASPNASTGSLTVKCVISSGTVNTEIDPGTDATFVLQADVVNGKISNSSTSTLQVSLQGFTTPSAQSLHPDSAHLIWNDKDNGSSANSTTFFRWIDYPDTSVNGTSYNG